VETGQCSGKALCGVKNEKYLGFDAIFEEIRAWPSFERKIAELCEAGPISDLKIAAAPQKLLQS
jgi:hypothetical protein